MNKQKSFLMHFAEMFEQYRSERRATSMDEASQPQRHSRLGRILHWFVPNGGTLLLITALILTQQVWAKPLASSTSAPGPSATTVNYQGRLADSGGTPLDGTYGMSFSLWDASTDGSVVWGPESHAAVPVSEGLFSVGLGSQTSGGIPTSVWDGDRYLEIAVGGETLSPRELIRSVPIAGMALTVPDGALTPANWTAFADEARDLAGRSTTSQTPVDFGSTSLTFNLPYRAMVYIYLRSGLRNPDGNCIVTVNIDGVDYINAGGKSLTLEVNGVNWQHGGTGAILTLDAGSHTIRPRFLNFWGGGSICQADKVQYGYIVLGLAP